MHVIIKIKVACMSDGNSFILILIYFVGGHLVNS